jgi:hypothetical protein
MDGTWNWPHIAIYRLKRCLIKYRDNFTFTSTFTTHSDGDIYKLFWYVKPIPVAVRFKGRNISGWGYSGVSSLFPAQGK